MLCVVEPAVARAGAGGLRALEIAARDRRGYRRRLVRVLDGDTRCVGDMPVERAGRRLPALHARPARPSEPLYPAPRACSSPRTRARRCWRCCARPNIADRRPLFEQYDCIVQSRTVRRPGSADAAVLALPPATASQPGIAVAIDGNGRRVAADPYRGTDRGGARARRQPRLRRRTSRSARPTASTSATPRSRTSPGS